MPARLIGGDLFIKDPYRRVIAADFDGVCAIPCENRARGGIAYLLILSPAHRAGPRCTVYYLIWFDERVCRQIIHLD